MTTLSVENNPAGFAPVYDAGQLWHYRREARDNGFNIDACEIIFPDAPEKVLYTLGDFLYDATAEEMRELVAAINAWWHSCESRLQGGAI